MHAHYIIDTLGVAKPPTPHDAKATPFHLING